MPPKYSTWAASVFKSTGLTMEEIKRIYDQEFLEGNTWMNGQYVVIEKTFPNGMTHLSIRRQDRKACRDWRDFQAIKNQLCGPEREGIELYPAESRVVDTANQFHIWVMAPGVTLPVGWRVRSVHGPKDMPVPGAVQREFEVEPRDATNDAAEVVAAAQELLNTRINETGDTVVTCADGSTEVVSQDELEAAADIYDRVVKP